MDKTQIMWQFYSFSFLLFSLTGPSTAKVINISLGNRIPTLNNSEIYGRLLTSEEWTRSSQFQLTNISKELHFIIVQAHTQYENITMSYNAQPTIGTSVKGTNVGLTIYPSERTTFYLHYLLGYTAFKTYLSIHAYFIEAPIPGGCNMEFNVQDAPYLQLTYNPHIINVDASPPGVFNKNRCDLVLQNVSMDFYHLYISEKDSSSELYFEDIKKMMTVDSILKNGRKVSNTFGYGMMRRVFSLYPDIGTVYGVIVTDGIYSSAYVPIHTYGCSILSTCPYPPYIINIMYIAACVGLFLCFFGHFFFKVHIFVMGFVSTSLIAYCVFGYNTFEFVVFEEILLIISAACGVVGGVCWLIHWCCCSLPITITFLNTFCSGTIAAMITYYAMPDSQPLLELDINFWGVFIIVILICQLLMLLSQYSIMISCAILGSFLLILPLDIAIGSYLRYILINLIRRVRVEKFDHAVIDPPFQWRDIVTTVLWFIVAVCGMKIQWMLSKRRAPFPPPPISRGLTQVEVMENIITGTTENNVNENSRLLRNVYPNYSAPPPYPYSQASAPITNP